MFALIGKADVEMEAADILATLSSCQTNLEVRDPLERVKTMADFARLPKEQAEVILGLWKFHGQPGKRKRNEADLNGQAEGPVSKKSKDDFPVFQPQERNSSNSANSTNLESQDVPGGGTDDDTVDADRDVNMSASASSSSSAQPNRLQDSAEKEQQAKRDGKDAKINEPQNLSDRTDGDSGASFKGIESIGMSAVKDKLSKAAISSSAKSTDVHADQTDQASKEKKRDFVVVDDDEEEGDPDVIQWMGEPIAPSTIEMRDQGFASYKCATIANGDVIQTGAFVWIYLSEDDPDDKGIGRVDEMFMEPFGAKSFKVTWCYTDSDMKLLKKTRTHFGVRQDELCMSDHKQWGLGHCLDMEYIAGLVDVHLIKKIRFKYLAYEHKLERWTVSAEDLLKQGNQLAQSSSSSNQSNQFAQSSGSKDGKIGARQRCDVKRSGSSGEEDDSSHTAFMHCLTASTDRRAKTAYWLRAEQLLLDPPLPAGSERWLFSECEAVVVECQCGCRSKRVCPWFIVKLGAQEDKASGQPMHIGVSCHKRIQCVRQFHELMDSYSNEYRKALKTFQDTKGAVAGYITPEGVCLQQQPILCNQDTRRMWAKCEDVIARRSL